MSAAKKFVPSAIEQHFNGVYAELGECIENDKALQALGNSYVAGGAIVSLVLGETPKDYDIWFRNIEDWTTVTDAIKRNPIRKSKYSWSYQLSSGIEVQLVKSRLGEPAEVVGTFDFKHTHCYYELGCAAVYDEAFIKSKKLTFVRGNLCHPVNTFQRVLKFHKRGYNVTNKTLSDMMNETGEIYQQRQAEKSFEPSSDEPEYNPHPDDVFYPGWGGGGEDGGSR